MIDQDRLTIASRTLMERNMRILQGFRLAVNEREHIGRLLDHMKPEPYSVWLDIGSGFGWPAAIMQQLRPDIEFFCVNNNEFQLAHMPLHLPRFHADMHAMPFDNACADGAMYLFSLCHADSLFVALREAARVVRPGGRLFVFDYVRACGDDVLSMRHLDARFPCISTLNTMALYAGWKAADYVQAEGSDAVFREVFENDELYDLIFDDLVPVLWQAVRR